MRIQPNLHRQTNSKQATEPPAALKSPDVFSSAETTAWQPIPRVAELLNSRPNTPRVERATDSDALFNRRSGWAGADGAYSVPMPDGSTLWLFSDTFWGDVNDDGSRGDGTAFVNNTVGHQDSTGNVRFYHGGGDGKPKSVLTPPDGKGWFWQHDAVVDASGKISVLLGQFDRTPGGGALGFKAIGSWLAEMEMGQDGPEVSKYLKLPHFQEATDGKPSIFFGSAVLKEESYQYVYGVADHAFTKDALLARVKSDDLNQAESWEFFDGEGWSSDFGDAKPVAKGVSVEHSVHRTANGEYAMVAQVDNKIQVRRAPSPEGPWSEPENVWTTPEQVDSDMTYNAKAHPELSDNRGLLISYNVNTMDWDRNLGVAEVYRPRFIRLSDPNLLPKAE